MTNRFTLGQHKAIFTLELPDGGELLLTVPPLSVFKRMAAMQDSTGVDEMIDIVCDILNCNRTGATFTPKEVAGLLPLTISSDFCRILRLCRGGDQGKN